MNINITNDTSPRSPNRVILDLIPSGRNNAISMRELAQILKTSKREVRHLIERARISGNIIAGTSAGIFIPETDDELREYVNRTKSRIRTSSATVQPAIALLRGLSNAE